MRTNKLIRLYSMALQYLELIKDANNRAERKKADLRLYDATKDWTQPIRLMYRRSDLQERIIRYEILSYYLQKRLINLQNTINDELLRVTPESYTLQTIEL